MVLLEINIWFLIDPCFPVLCLLIPILPILYLLVSGQTVQELEAMVTAQNSLVSKLREECRHLAGKLEHITDKYR